MRSRNLVKMIEVSGLSDDKFGRAFGCTKDQITNYRIGRITIYVLTPIEMREEDIPLLFKRKTK